MDSGDEPSPEAPVAHSKSTPASLLAPTRPDDLSDLDGTSSVVYHPRSDTYWAGFDPGLDSPSSAIVESIAAVTDRSPLDLDPLYDVVDADALDAFVGSTATDERSGDLGVSFRYQGCDVAVYGSGEIAVAPEEETDREQRD